MQFVSMCRILTTQELNRLGFNHEDIRFARKCCLLRLSRGVYVAKHVCAVETHRPLWAGIEDSTFEAYPEYGDMRDEVTKLDAAVMARCEQQFQRRQSRSGVGTEPSDGETASSSSGTEVISHISAALIHGLPLASPVTHQVEVVRPGINRRFANLHVRGTPIPKHHQGTIRGMRVTTLERTLVDVARAYSLEISVAMIDDALHRRLTTPEKILTVLGQTVEKRNTKKVRRALELADGRRESPAESIAAVRFYEHGIHGMSQQVSFVIDEAGTQIRVDFCHRQARLIVEIDGLGKLYLGSGVPREELKRERRREQWLRDRGWQVIRISWKELFSEAKFEEIKLAIMRSETAAATSAR